MLQIPPQPYVNADQVETDLHRGERCATVCDVLARRPG